MACCLSYLLPASKQFNQHLLLLTPRRYAQVLRANPACPAEVRLGIAACYYRAGKLEAATAAYNRVLQLDATSADALLGLAVIKFGSSNVQEVRRRAAFAAER
jgi:RNA polymerase-associated protein CTR9